MKASKRLYFLVQLKRAKVTRTDLGLFYRLVVDQLWTTQYRPFTSVCLINLMHDLERVQKRAIISIICPGVSYHEALVIMIFKELAAHHDEIFESLFNNHRFYRLLLAPHESTYS